MAESHEPSYYEIALTNRQVVVAFVLLLTCLLGAFFSGVWIGRESTARAAQEQLVRNTPPVQQAAQEGRNLEELEFFDSRNKKGEKKGAASEGQQTATAPPAANSTLLQDLTRRQPTPPAPAPSPERTPPATTAPAPQQAAPAPAESLEPTPAQARAERRRKRREAAEAAAAAGAPAPAAKTGKGAEPAIPKGAFVIQVFSSPDKAQAESIRSKLTGGGQKAYLSPVDRGGRTMYRVRIGPFKSRGDAQTVADKVRKGYKLDTWVTE